MMLVALSKSFGHIFKGLLWALFYLLVYLSIFMPIPHCFDYCSFLVSFKVKKCESSSFVLSFEDCSGILGPLIFHVNFRMSFSISEKKKSLDLYIALNWFLFDGVSFLINGVP